MDVRDVNVEVIYPGSSSFSDLLTLQKLLLDHYIGIEGLPQYPIDVNTKKSQDLIKDFAGRTIEELGEGYQSYLDMIDMNSRGIAMEKLEPHLQNFNEEVADAIHFFLELMIYSGFETETVAKWLGAKPNEDLIEKGLEFGGFLVNTEQQFKRFPCKHVIKDKEVKDIFLQGGRKLSNDIKDEYRKLLWDITYWLQILRNTLKNKPWKQTHMMTDVNLYESCMSNAFTAIFKFFYFAGFTKESLYEIYYKKNKVNQFRIKSKY